MPAFFRYPYSLTSPNDRVRDDSIGYVGECIRTARQLGARQVLIVPTASLYGQTTDDARDRFHDSLNQLCELASQSEMLLAIEILHPRLTDFMYSSAQALATLETLKHPCLKVVLDTGHLHLAGETIEQAFAALKDAVVQVHVNDNDGLQQQNAVPGTGTYDFDGLKGRLERAGYDGYLTVELGWQYSFDPNPPVLDGLRRMRAYLGQN
jgi:protein FrlC